MKVLHIFPELGIGGTEKVILQISDYIGSVEDAKIGMCSTDGPKKADFEKRGIKLFNIPNFKEKSKILSNIYYLKKASKEFDPDIVHTHSLYALLIMFLVRKAYRRRFKIVHTGHGGPRKNYDFFAGKLVKLCDAYLTISKTSFEYLRTKGNNAYYVRNGVDIPDDTEVYKVSKKGDMDFLDVAFIGRLTEQKGIPTIIEAINMLQPNLNIKLHIVGDGEDRQKLELMVANLGLGEKISFLGYMRNPWKYVQSIPIVVMPSLWEPGGLVALEAIVRNHTLIATNVGGLKEEIVDGENGYLIEVNDAMYLAKLILEIYNGEKNYLVASEQVKNNYYFNKSTGPKIRQIYKDLIER